MLAKSSKPNAVNSRNTMYRTDLQSLRGSIIKGKVFGPRKTGDSLFDRDKIKMSQLKTRIKVEKFLL